MFADITSPFYNYIRGAVLVMAVFHFINYTIYRKSMYAYYSGYFLALSLFFLGETIRDYPTRKLYSYFYSSIHLISYFFYIGFARSLLHTKAVLPQWDRYLSGMQKFLLLGGIPLIGLGYLIAGKSGESVVFYTLSPLITIFSIVMLYKIYRLNTFRGNYFVYASSLFIIMANLSLLSQMVFGLKNFLEIFHFRAALFTYVGALLESLMFAFLMGALVKELEKKKNEKKKQIEKLKIKQTQINKELIDLQKVVVKDYILLKNNTKVNIADLLYFHSKGHYIGLFTEHRKEFIRGKMSELLKQLPPNFARVHRSYIVNLNHVQYVDSKNAIFTNKAMVPISKNRKNDIKLKLEELQKRMYGV